jgi:hypothetical protein
MTRKIVSVATLAALFNLNFVGCSKVVNLTLDEVAVDTPKRITAVVTKTGEKVTFDEKGGKYDRHQRRITGADVDGERLIRSLKVLDSVRVVDLTESSLPPISIVAQNFHDYMRPCHTDKLVSVVTKLGVTHKFSSGGLIDPLDRVVLGLSTTRTSMRIPFDSVDCVRVKKTDWVKTALLLTTTTALIVVLVISSIHPSIPWDNEWELMGN